MPFDTKPTPRLPPELLDRIVEFADYWSARSCLLVSRYFHSCAERNIYRDCEVILNVSHENLKDLHKHLFTEELDPPLGGTGRFVRSISIRFFNVFVVDNPPIDEESVLPLLESVREMPRLETLRIFGGFIEQHPRIKFKTDWNQVPRSVQKALLSTFGVISTLLIQDIKHFPIHSLCNHTRLQNLVIYNCGGPYPPPAVARVASAMSIPNLNYLSTNKTLPFFHGSMLPALKSVTITNSSRDKCEMAWKEIKGTFRNLEEVCVSDVEKPDTLDAPNYRMHPSIPADLKLDMFQNLVSLSYLYDGRAWADRPNDIPFLGDVLNSFEVSKTVPKLKTITLTLILNGGDAPNDSFWVEKKDALANDPSWSSLDRILTSGLYPRLQQLDITLRFINCIFRGRGDKTIHDIKRDRIDRRLLETDLKPLILDHLVKLQAKTDSVFVKLSTDYEIG